MQLINTFDISIFFLCVVYIYNTCDSAVNLKDKKNITITNAFQISLDDSNCKTNRIWTFIDFSIENNEKDPQRTDSENVRILRYKYIFVKVYAPNMSECWKVLR